MIRLGVGVFGRRFSHRRILLERVVVLFNSPPSLVDCRELGLVQARIAADQISHALRPVFVGKDLSGYQHHRLERAQPDAQGLLIGKSKSIEGLKLAVLFGFLAQGHGAGRFQGHDKVVAQFQHLIHIVRRGIPAVGQQVLVGHLLLGHAEHGPQVLILGILALIADFLGFCIGHGLSFLDKLDGDGHGQGPALIEQAQEVEALDKTPLAVVVMGANHRAGVRVRLFQNRIIDDKHRYFVGRRLALGLPNQGLGLCPDLFGIQLRRA